MPLQRQALRDLAEDRLLDAKALLASGQYGGAYYLAGYAAELGLKACLAAGFRSDEIPDWPYFRDARTHDVARLADLVGLTEALRAEKSRSSDFERHWQIVLGRAPESRYRAATGPELARGLIEALSAEDDGVLAWIRQHW